VKELQDALAAKIGRLAKVKLLSPVGEKRVQASSQLINLGIPLRHLAVLENLDISFSIFDSARSVLPTISGNLEQTIGGVTVESTKLAEMLEVFFNDLWSRFDALTHADFVRYTVRQILQTAPDMTLPAIANKLKIDETDLKKLIPTFGASNADPLFFFIIGRPCSGKTTVAEALHLTLAQRGITRHEVYYFNDYKELYQRFREDESQRIFEPAEHGGFAVHDYSVLDTVLQQANLRLQIGASFHRACIVEFARDTYLEPFLNFERSILEKTTVIHVKCSHNSCRKRNMQRRDLSSDHRTGYVPDDILSSFYASEDTSNVQTLLRNDIIEIDTDEIPLQELPFVVQEKLSHALGKSQQPVRSDGEC
jgi:hypothetical protein